MWTWFYWRRKWRRGFYDKALGCMRPRWEKVEEWFPDSERPRWEEDNQRRQDIAVHTNDDFLNGASVAPALD
jgi:hypothetical protein